MSEGEQEDTRHRPMDSARNVVESLLGLLGKRFELASVELQEEKYRVTDLFFRAVLFGVLGLMSLLLLSFFVVVLCWDTAARLYVIVGLAAVYGVSAWRVYTTLRRKVEDSPTPFAASVEELRKDAEWFQKKS